MPRQARIDFPGAMHHVVGRGIEGRFIFKKDACKLDFYRRIKKNLTKYDMSCYAWCIMGNHFHLLLQSGKTSLPEFMSGLLTGYALYYNLTQKRKGHLFQNRYKSILCDKDEYLMPLIRYIHLNPLKSAGVSLQNLEKYVWTGHKEICRGEKGLIENRDEILGYFGNRVGEALRNYKEFVKDGLNIKVDYEGGGLARSAGGTENVLRRKKDEHEMYDDRILGGGEFVKAVYENINEENFAEKKMMNKEKLLRCICDYYGLEKVDLIGSRVRSTGPARKMYIYFANQYLGETLTSLGSELGMGRAAACKARKNVQEAPDHELIKELNRLKNH